MKVTSISTGSVSAYDTMGLINSDTIQKTPKKDSISTDSYTASTSWQKDILLSALDSLENNIQNTDSSHPLSKQSSAPIESYQEALIELSFVKSPFFRVDASQAQANLTPEDVVGLFMEA